MPSIKQYQYQSNAVGPVDFRTVPNTGIGQGIASLGASVSDAAIFMQKKLEADEINDAAKNLAEKKNQTILSQKEGLEKGKYSTKDFLADYDASVKDLSEKYTTGAAQQYVERESAEAKNTLLKSAIAVESEVNTAAAKHTINATLNSELGSVYASPEMLTSSVKSINSLIVEIGKNGLIENSKLVSLQHEVNRSLVMSAAKGTFDSFTTPEQIDEYAKKIMSGSLDYIVGDKKDDLIGYARQAKSSLIADKMRMLREEKFVADQNTKIIEDSFVDKLLSNKLSSEDIRNSNLDPRKKLMWIDRIGKESNKSNPSTFDYLLKQIQMDSSDPNKKIRTEDDLNPYVNNGLSYSDFKRLRGEINGVGSAQGRSETRAKSEILSSAKRQLSKSDPLSGIVDPDGDANYLTFQNWFYDEFEKQKKAGKSTEQLLDPQSPEYLGKKIQLLKKSLPELANSLSSQVNVDPNRPKINPGESMDDFIKRANKESKK